MNDVKKVLILQEDATCFYSRGNAFQTLYQICKVNGFHWGCVAHLKTLGAHRGLGSWYKVRTRNAGLE